MTSDAMPDRPSRRHWILFLIPGVVMVILGLLAAASPFIATLVLDTFAGWLFLTGVGVNLFLSVWRWWRP
jgi:uncharacterized membrane protein HdeD (DUF308 family)